MNSKTQELHLHLQPQSTPTPTPTPTPILTPTPKMKATLKGKYGPTKTGSALGTLTIPAGDLNLRASFTDASFNPSLSGLVLSLDKPNSFSLDYNLPKSDLTFRFTNTLTLPSSKPLHLAYSHSLADNKTDVNASLAFDPANKLNLSYGFSGAAMNGSSSCKVRYVYACGEKRDTVVEPGYDVGNNVWDFAVMRRFDGGDSVKGTYHTGAKTLGVEWNRDSPLNGCFKISASFNLAEQNVKPKITAESTLKYEFSF